jgi:hypothetical protein
MGFRCRQGQCIPCSPEVCDGEDNDCDHFVDQGLYHPTSLETIAFDSTEVITDAVWRGEELGALTMEPGARDPSIHTFLETYARNGQRNAPRVDLGAGRILTNLVPTASGYALSDATMGTIVRIVNGAAASSPQIVAGAMPVTLQARGDDLLLATYETTDKRQAVLRIIDAAGTVAATTTLTETEIGAFIPSLRAIGTPQGFLIVWTECILDAAGGCVVDQGGPRVVLWSTSFSGGALPPPVRLSDPSTRPVESAMTLAPWSDGAVLLWVDGQNDTSVLYAQELDSVGQRRSDPYEVWRSNRAVEGLMASSGPGEVAVILKTAARQSFDPTSELVRVQPGARNGDAPIPFGKAEPLGSSPLAWIQGEWVAALVMAGGSSQSVVNISCTEGTPPDILAVADGGLPSTQPSDDGGPTTQPSGDGGPVSPDGGGGTISCPPTDTRDLGLSGTIRLLDRSVFPANVLAGGVCRGAGAADGVFVLPGVQPGTDLVAFVPSASAGAAYTAFQSSDATVVVPARGNTQAATIQLSYPGAPSGGRVVAAVSGGDTVATTLQDTTGSIAVTLSPDPEQAVAILFTAPTTDDGGAPAMAYRLDTTGVRPSSMSSVGGPTSTSAIASVSGTILAPSGWTLDPAELWIHIPAASLDADVTMKIDSQATASGDFTFQTAADLFDLAEVFVVGQAFSSESPLLKKSMVASAPLTAGETGILLSVPAAPTVTSPSSPEVQWPLAVALSAPGMPALYRVTLDFGPTYDVYSRSAAFTVPDFTPLIGPPPSRGALMITARTFYSDGAVADDELPLRVPHPGSATASTSGYTFILPQ